MFASTRNARRFLSPLAVAFLSALRFPKNSIRQIDGVWKKLDFLMMGERLTLDRLEHEILRKRYSEPRIHMAIVCAAMGCPFLRGEPYEGSTLDAQLDDQSRRYLASARGLRVDRTKGKVSLSKIFDWFAGDFVKVYSKDGFPERSREEGAVLNFVSKYVDDSTKAFLKTKRPSVGYLDYDWSLNERNTKLREKE